MQLIAGIPLAPEETTDLPLSPASCGQSALPRTSVFPVHSAHKSRKCAGKGSTRPTRCGSSIKWNFRTDWLNGVVDNPPY
jgi:hypothetical protein